MHVSDNAGTARVEIRVEEATALMVDLPQCGFDGTVGIGVGLYCAAGTYEVRYDDLVADYP